MAQVGILQFYGGTFAGLPTLAAREPGWCTDTFQLFIGDGATNHEVGAAGLSVSGIDNHAVRMNGTAGLQDSDVVISDTGDVSGVEDLEAVGDVDFSAATSCALPVDSTPTTDDAGEIVLDQDSDGGTFLLQGWFVYSDGTTDTMKVPGVDAWPSAENQVLAYDDVNKKLYWRTLRESGIFFFLSSGGIVVDGNDTLFDVEEDPDGGTMIGGESSVVYAP